MSDLVALRDSGGPLSDEEVVGTAILLFVAGFVTTTNLIGNGLLALLRWPDQLARLRADRSLVQLGVQEMLRYDTPVQLVAGRRWSRSSSAMPARARRGRDRDGRRREPGPGRFSDPERLDVGRTRPAAQLRLGDPPLPGLGPGLAGGPRRLRPPAGAFPVARPGRERPPHRAGALFRGLDRLPVKVS